MHKSGVAIANCTSNDARQYFMFAASILLVSQSLYLCIFSDVVLPLHQPHRTMSRTELMSVNASDLA